MRQVRLEVCVDTIAGAEVAAAAGADRIELCSALEVGGLTPSLGLMKAAADLPVPSYAMIRPRAGDFTYSSIEADIMQRDIAAAKDMGLAGVVFGALTPEGALDKALMKPLFETGLKATLHRAFDAAADPFVALEDAIELGFERILTAGQTSSAAVGAALIADLVKAAQGRISIMAGSGVSPKNVNEIMAATGVEEVHASCAAPVEAVSHRAVDLGFEPPEGRRETQAALIEDMLRVLSCVEETAA